MDGVLNIGMLGVKIDLYFTASGVTQVLRPLNYSLVVVQAPSTLIEKRPIPLVQKAFRLYEGIPRTPYGMVGKRVLTIRMPRRQGNIIGGFELGLPHKAETDWIDHASETSLPTHPLSASRGTGILVSWP